VPSRAPGFDPIEEARRQWVAHGWDDAADGMAAVTSVVRAEQLFRARIDALLAPFALTFARFEVLTLLSFTREGALPLGKIGVRLQVHPASVTNAVDRLEVQGFVRREAHPSDRRTTLAVLTPEGRRVARRAGKVLNDEVFADVALSERELRQLFALLRKVRAAAGDFD
jgi:DNA-binding MarR family transcriptional regulator